MSTTPPKSTADLHRPSPRPRLRNVYDLDDQNFTPLQPEPTKVQELGEFKPIQPPPGDGGFRYMAGSSLHPAQLTELCRGPQPRGAAFHSDEDRAQAWADHRGTILAWFAHLQISDRRPWALDRYEPAGAS